MAASAIRLDMSEGTVDMPGWEQVENECGGMKRDRRHVICSLKVDSRVKPFPIGDGRDLSSAYR
jgi:hypothetical protein